MRGHFASWTVAIRVITIPALAVALLDEAKRIAPRGLELLVNQDNARAIRFYEKHGFAISGEAINWRSGKPVHKMSWRPTAAP